MTTGPDVAFVQDAVPFIGGAERVLAAAWDVFPQAPLYTLIYNEEALRAPMFEGKRVHSSFLQGIPGARSRHRWFLPLMPLAIEQLDLREHDVVLSFSYAVAHGVMARPDQLHISYTYTPLRHAWHDHHRYLAATGRRRGLRGRAIQSVLHYLRLWDRMAADRVDRFAAVSQWVARGVWRAYRRPAKVLYPPVEVERFEPIAPRNGFYVAVSRFASHKKTEMILSTFARNGLPLIVVGGGPGWRAHARRAPTNIQLLGRLPDEEVARLLGEAKALVHAAEEDFGLALVEAQAAGCPVIAYGKGGAAETVIDGVTGILYPEQTEASLAEAVGRFERSGVSGRVHDLRENARRFCKARFQEDLRTLVQRTWEQFNTGRPGAW